MYSFSTEYKIIQIIPLTICIWLNNCSGRVQLSVWCEKQNPFESKSLRLFLIRLYFVCAQTPSKTTQKSLLFGNSNFSLFVLETISIGRAFSRPGESFFMRKMPESARSLNINIFVLYEFLLIFINLIFIFVYIKHRKFLLHLTEKFSLRHMGEID